MTQETKSEPTAPKMGEGIKDQTMDSGQMTLEEFLEEQRCGRVSSVHEVLDRFPFLSRNIIYDALANNEICGLLMSRKSGWVVATVSLERWLDQYMVGVKEGKNGK